MNNTQSNYINVPLPKIAHSRAEEFAAEQNSPEKGKQVYLNTLAVYAVHSYLKWLNIETSLNKGDSWHRGIRAIFDVADLELPGIGKLECRPVMPGESAIILPIEVTQDRIGYVALQFHEQLDSVELLGFATTAQAQTVTIQLAQLLNIDVLIETIHKHSLSVNLRQWLKGIFNPDWQSPELVFAESFRRSITITKEQINRQLSPIGRAKVINLGCEVVLLVQVTPTQTEVFDIRLRVYPGEDAVHLPPGLQMIILDEAENTCMEAQARNADDWVQLEFSCQHEEKFIVKLVLGDTETKEEFAV
jgi:Protein of unknown function (DUF1822)